MTGISSGLPATAVDANAGGVSPAVAIALDVGGTNIKCALVDTSGLVRHTEHYPTDRERGPEAVVQTILTVAAGLVARARSFGWHPVAVGAVVPAVVDETNGIAEWSANLGFRNVPLRDMLSRSLDLPAALGHDVRAGALAEARLGQGRGHRRSFFMAIGTGIAGGFVLDGRIDPGAHGAAGELGHVAVRGGPEARICGCGGRGCLETVSSAASVARAYTNATGEMGVTAEEVAERVRRGEPAAAGVWQDAASALADGLLIAVALYDPEVIVLGGGLARSGALLVDPVRALMTDRKTFHRLPAVTQSGLGDQAGCLGAALLALDLVTAGT